MVAQLWSFADDRLRYLAIAFRGRAEMVRLANAPVVPSRPLVKHRISDPTVRFQHQRRA
jgi:hypothetical protein